MAMSPLSMHLRVPGVELLEHQMKKSAKVKVDTSNIFVCAYDDKVDLFCRKEYSTITHYSEKFGFHCAGFFYKGINSKDVAVYEQTNTYGGSNGWKDNGYVLGQDVVSCKIDKIVSFNKMINLMGINSEIAENTDIIKENMVSILEFASDYFQLGNKRTEKHIKVKVKKLPEQES